MPKKEQANAVALNTQNYKLAASGAGVIVCQQLTAHSFRALLSKRAAVVGIGLGITGGGFVEIGPIFKNELPGFIIETAAEAWREAKEENIGFDFVFPLEKFIERAQSIANFHVRVADENGVHGTNYYALAVNDDEWTAVAGLGPSDEREGSLLEIHCDFHDTSLMRRDAHEHISLRSLAGEIISPAAFYHQHELHAFGQIAWHVQQSRLWSSQ